MQRFACARGSFHQLEAAARVRRELHDRMSSLDLTKLRQLDGSLLVILRELLRHRRTTLVAARLGLTQSAVSHALGRLRELFGDPLFMRRPHGLEPTRHALELAPRVEALLTAMDEMMVLPRLFAPATTTRGFRIGAPDHISTLVAPSLVKRFAETAPRAQFLFHQRLGRDALNGILRDELDVALGRFDRQDERLSSQALFEDHYCLVARRQHPLLKRTLTRAKFAELGYVQISVSGDFRSPVFGGVSTPVRPRVVAAVPRFLIAFAVVARSDAVVIAPSKLARRHAVELGLKVYELPFALPPIQVWAVHLSRNDPGTAFLLDELRHAVAET